MRELLLPGTGELFVICWACLSLVVTRRILECDRNVKAYMKQAMKLFAEEDTDDIGNHDCHKIDDTPSESKW